jgi:flagellar basal-body rod protein FlgB
VIVDCSGRGRPAIAADSGLKPGAAADEASREHGLLEGATERRTNERQQVAVHPWRPGWESVMLEDVSITALHAALNGLSVRQRAISDDIANVNTPFYRAKSVAFEGDLRRALADGEDPMEVAATVTRSTAPVGLTFSNVDLNEETMSSVNTQLAYDLAIRATGDRFSLLRTAAKGA